ncbi:MAG TPA: enoyl-CoA hydratase-related protein [Steroidobacteraceae bacterium]|nr:enoyl-CoA hydratase-related protein [Steroidobacteraceae bacterium]
MDPSSYSNLRLEREGRLLRAHFNRPQHLNAIDHATHEELGRFFADVATDPLTDVVILSGTGRAFSAGGDLDHIQRLIDDPARFVADIPVVKRIVFGILDCPKVLLAKLNGPAVGLGATIALLCDVVFAAETAVIGDPHVKVGFTAGDGGALIWPHLIGHARAKEYLMTGRTLTAGEAARIGLINHAVPPADLDRVVDEFAQELLRGAMRAIQWTKLSVNIGLKQVAHAVLDASIAYEALSNSTADHQEAVRAFRDKREPRFTGR